MEISRGEGGVSKAQTLKESSTRIGVSSDIGGWGFETNKSSTGRILKFFGITPYGSHFFCFAVSPTF